MSGEQMVRIETSAVLGMVTIDIYLTDGSVLTIGHDGESTRQLARTLEMAAEVAETGKPLADGETTKTERLAIEMCARWILLRGGCNTREDALIRARDKILDPARRWQ